MKTINFSVTADCDNQEWARSDSAGGVKIILPKKAANIWLRSSFLGKTPAKLPGLLCMKRPPTVRFARSALAEPYADNHTL